MLPGITGFTRMNSGAQQVVVSPQQPPRQPLLASNYKPIPGHVPAHYSTISMAG